MLFVVFGVQYFTTVDTDITDSTDMILLFI